MMTCIFHLPFADIARPTMQNAPGLLIRKLIHSAYIVQNVKMFMLLGQDNNDTHNSLVQT